MLVVQRLLNENRKLFSENSSLRHHVGDLTKQCTNLHNQLNSIQCQLALLVAVHDIAKTQLGFGMNKLALGLMLVTLEVHPLMHITAYDVYTWQNKKSVR